MPNQRITIIIDDTSDDNAEKAQRAWAAGEFDLADLLGSLDKDAEISVKFEDI